MIRHDPTWLCPRRTRLYIHYLGKVYVMGKMHRIFISGMRLVTPLRRSIEEKEELDYKVVLAPVRELRLVPLCFSHAVGAQPRDRVRNATAQPLHGAEGTGRQGHVRAENITI